MQLLFQMFLWGLLGISIPLLIHLFQLRSPQRLQFTNTGLIREVELNVGRKQLQDLLVLLLRILAICFLVLAFCQPYIPVHIGNTDGGESDVFIDTSPSMQMHNSEGINLLTSAIHQAQSLVRRPDARFRIIGQRGNTLSENAHYNVVTKPLIRGQLGWGSMVGRRAWQAPMGGPLYLFSDFQKNEVTRGALKRISGGRKLVLVPLASSPTSNLFVDSVWLNDAFVRMRTDIALHVRVRNGGVNEVKNSPIKVLLGKQQVAAFEISVAPGQAVEKVVQVQVPSQHSVIGRVLTEDKPVTFDNTYSFVLQPTEAIRIVEIGPEPLAQAAYKNEPLFRYSFNKPQQVNFGELKAANLVLLTEPSSIDASLRDALLAVVRRGSSVVVVPPATGQAHADYAQLLQVLGTGAVQWTGITASEPVRQEVAMPNPQSPFFREVFGAQPRQALLPEASPVLQVSGSGTDIMRLQDGEGFLTEFASGLGRTYVFSTPFDKKYSDFTTQSLFVPVLYRLALLSYHTEQPLAYRIGQPALMVRVPLAATTMGEAGQYRLVRDSLTLVPTQRLVGQELRLEIPAELTLPGFYQLQLQGRPVATLAFNIARKESELATYTAAELRQLIGPNRPNVQVLDEGTQPDALLRYEAGQTAQPLWRYCLLLALACLLAEGLVLRWGRRTMRPLVAAA